MIFELSRLFLKNTRKRLRPSGQAPDKGVLAFVNKPAIGLLYWLLVWLAAFLLQMVPTLQEVGNGVGTVHHSLGIGGPIRLVPGRASPVTIVSAIDFHYLDKQPARVTSVRINSEGQAQPNLVLVSAGTVLVQRGQEVDAETIKKIRGYQAQVKNSEPFSSRLQKLAGDGMLLFLGVMITAIMFRFICLGGPQGAAGKAWIPTSAIAPNSMILLFLLVSLLSLAPVKWL
ncbi:MAG: hypothetical protein ABIH24_01675, partial [Verrucomicrobiota bacterium]